MFVIITLIVVITDIRLYRMDKNYIYKPIYSPKPFLTAPCSPYNYYDSLLLYRVRKEKRTTR